MNLKWQLLPIIGIVYFVLIVSCTGKTGVQKPIDPFKVYMPDFDLAVEQNEHYQAWDIHGEFIGGIFRKKIYKSSLNDTLYYVSSGIQPFDGVNVGFCARNLIFLPPQSQQMKICVQYEYSHDPDDEDKLYFEVVFKKSTVVLQKDSVILPSTYRIDREEEITQNVNTKEFILNIPDQADNAVLQIKDKGLALAMVALRRCDIEIDGKALSTYAYNHSLPFTRQEIKSIQSKMSDSLIIPADTRLLGIGESIGGCKELEQQRTDIIKDLINNQQVQFCGYEIGFLLGYKINEYIHGRLNDIEEILKEGEASFNNQVNIDLFRFMRYYNEQHNYPLTVMGFDIDFQLQQPERIWTQLERLFPDNQKISRCLNRFFDMVTAGENLSPNQIDELQKILKESKGDYIDSLYERYFQQILSDYMNHFGYTGIDRISFKQRRDRIMAENIIFYFSNLPENSKMIVAGHLDVLSKKQHAKNELNTSSIGYYLSEKFEGQYRVIGLYAGYGSFFDYPISYPIGKSLEQLCLELNKPVFYLNNIQTVPLLDKTAYSRTIKDQYFLMQFEPSDIRREVDIIWFRKECHSI
ncbi:MAG: erythromycin esterase family protein [Dysgonamonadaceae bacterium]|jgi:hypothetical protein|nr:erythromycin esterase family protein [Dysgonamonadaceae bacterium]